jgi:hypothetical protein
VGVVCCFFFSLFVTWGLPPPPPPPPNLGDSTFEIQPLDILIFFILYYFWNERCHLKFEGSGDNSKVLQLVWISIVKVGMAFCHVLNY